MDEISQALRVVNTTIKTVKAIDAVKKSVIAASVGVCCIIAIKLLRNQKEI